MLVDKHSPTNQVRTCESIYEKYIIVHEKYIVIVLSFDPENFSVV